METLYSPSWYHAAELRPCLNQRVCFNRHVYRGEIWFVIQNPTTGRVHRLTPAAHALVRQMDGLRSAHEIWHAVWWSHDSKPNLVDWGQKELDLIYWGAGMIDETGKVIEAVTSLSQLHDKTMLVKVSIKPEKDGYQARNEVRGIKPDMSEVPF